MQYTTVQKFGVHFVYVLKEVSYAHYAHYLVNNTVKHIVNYYNSK